MNKKQPIPQEVIAFLLGVAIIFPVTVICIYELHQTKRIARAYYYKYQLETQDDRYMSQVEDAKVIKYLEIDSMKQLENDVRFLIEKY